MFESASLKHKVDKTTFRREEPKLREALLNAQYDLKQKGSFPVLILIAGVEGAGKGETVNLLNEWMDPRHIETHAFFEKHGAKALVLGRFVPAFGKIVAMMQFNMYHHYTVDEHLLRCIGVLAEIERGSSNESPLANELIHKILPEHRELLYVTLFLHDIAKGRPEDHSIAGARVARRFCPRMGFSAADTDTVAWLIENHLVMSSVAQSRDLSDRKTIENFAATVQSAERLKLLTILTTADIRAVGPGVWNSWKAQLLRTLYYETEPVLTGGFSEAELRERGAAAVFESIAELRERLDSTPLA